MPTGGQLRRKEGPIKKRLEDVNEEVKIFLLLDRTKVEATQYFQDLNKLCDKLHKRIQTYEELEKQLEELANTDAEESRLLDERGDEYVTVLLDAKEYEGSMMQIRDLISQSRDEMKKDELESLKVKHDLELEKEREAWKLQMNEMQLKGDQEERKRRLQIEQELETQKLHQLNELEQRKLDLEKYRLEIETRSQETEARYKKEENLTENSDPPKQCSMKGNVKLPKLDFCKFSGNVLKWKEFYDAFDSAIHQNSTLSDVDKFNYLKAKLEDEALLSIAGLELTSANYGVALNILKERFGDQQRVIDAHYGRLMNIPAAPNQIPLVRSIFDEIEMHLRTLTAVGQDINQPYMITMIKSKIPKEIMAQIEMQKGKETWTVELLRESVRNNLKAHEVTESTALVKQESKVSSGKTTFPGKAIPSSLRSTTQVLLNNSNRNVEKRNQQFMKSCRYCQGPHFSDQCLKYSTPEMRKNRIKGCCFICLRPGHTVRECRIDKPCIYCQRRRNHHRSLCPSRIAYQTKNEKAPQRMLIGHESEIQPPRDELVEPKRELGLLAVGESVIMQTARIIIRNPNNSYTSKVRVLFDTGSLRSYVTETLMRRLKAHSTRVENVHLLTFGSNSSKSLSTPIVMLELIPKSGKRIPLEFAVIPVITGKTSTTTVDLFQVPFPFEKYEMSEEVSRVAENSSIDVLIGNDYYNDLITARKVQIVPGLYLLESRFGWILSGRFLKQETEVQAICENIEDPEKPEISALFSDADYDLSRNLDLADFWSLETIGIKDCPIKSDDDKALEMFNSTIRFEKGRYQVCWPWKEENPNLPSNYHLAYGRLKALLKRLWADSDLFQKYGNIITDQLEKGIIEEVFDEDSTNLLHYIPHHAVVSPSRKTTKVRIVYDASAKSRKENLSLNECLYRGPVLLEDLCGILLRFRLGSIAMVADIEKAFLQIALQPKDRDVTRFLWVRNMNLKALEGNTRIFRFTRVPFGVISSPFLLAATIAFHLSKEDSEISSKFKESLYVDNLIMTASSYEEAIALYKEAKKVFNNCSMNLREWNSNNVEFMGQLNVSDKSVDNKMKVLGLTWEISEDCLRIRTPCFKINQESVTKRDVLKTIASIFDPLGLLSPVLLKAKLFGIGILIGIQSWVSLIRKNGLPSWRICYRFRDLSSNEIFCLIRLSLYKVIF